MIDPKHLPYLTEMRAVTTDENGEQVLVGLSASETAEYFAYSEGRLNGTITGGDHELGARYLELHDKHEPARIQVICAEAERRVLNPAALN